jgi:hypothetical protein
MIVFHGKGATFEIASTFRLTDRLPAAPWGRFSGRVRYHRRGDHVRWSGIVTERSL